MAITVQIMYYYIITQSPSSKENMRDKQLSGGEESEEEEAWESVTIDVEHWARLSEMLELLTELSLVCGSVGLKPLPLVLFIEQVEDEEMFDVRRVKIKMLFEGAIMQTSHYCIYIYI